MIRYFILSFSLLLALPAVAQQYRDAAFPGGLDSMIQYINRHIIIPDAATLTEKGAYSRVSFEITSKGKIINIKAAPGNDADNVYSLAIIHLVKGMPDFKPGIIGGSRTTMEYSIGGRFHLEKQADSVTLVKVFSLEQPPRFPGGLDGLADYLRNTVRFPTDASKNGISANIKVSFDVDENGTPVNVSVPGRQVGFGLEEEAIRAVNEMPGWVPGIRNNKKVKVHFNLPIRFTPPPPRV